MTPIPTVSCAAPAAARPPLRRRAGPSLLRAAALALALSLPPAAGGAAAADQRATIEGRVQNAVLGRYLPNARVAIRGTDVVAFTDEFGAYRLTAVPVGQVVLEVFYTGLDPSRLTLQTTAGGTLVQDVTLTSVARYGPGVDPVKLDTFVVSTSKETEGEALATNEQRFAPNLKNVVATDTFGDVQEGNLGEFIKFLPGVMVNYGDAEAQSVSLRGFTPNLTALTVDGAEVSNANYSGSSRTPLFGQTSITNVSRVEVSKVPTPSSNADSLGGSVNMVSKSAFERSRAELRYRAYLSANSNRVVLRDPYTFDERTYKILPNFDFDYTLPINRDLGIVLTGLTSNFYNEQRIHESAWLAIAAGTPASQANPFRTSDGIVDAPRYTWRKALGANADWRISPHGVLSLDLSYSETQAQTANVGRSALPGSSPTPTVAVAAGGVPLSFGPDFTIGATGRGSVTLSGNSINRYERTHAGKLRYRFDDGQWRVTSALSRSASSARVRGGGDGWVFTSLAGTLDQPVRISLTNISAVGDGDSTTVVRAYGNDNREIDLNNLANYRITTASISVRDITDDVVYGDAHVRRRLGFLAFPASVQAGGLHRVKERDSRLPGSTFNYNGAGGSLSAQPYGYQLYVNQNSGFGARNINFINVGRASRAFTADPRLFSQTAAQVVATAQSAITNSEYLREAVSAGYVQIEMQPLGQRLNLLTGVRYEGTASEGQGPVYDPAAVWVRTANGTFARNAAGQRIRRPEAGATGSLEELRLTRQERANHARGSYSGYYPSLHLTWRFTDGLLARAAYARTYGRPNFTEIIPNVVVNERDLTDEQLRDPSVLPGTLTVRNTSLKPWTADNFDLSLEQYTAAGGTFTGGVFRKQIRDFFATDVRLATAADIDRLGLDSRYVGYEMSSKINAGDARIDGIELAARHSLAPLGGWGRHFTAFANATKLRLHGDRQADFTGFITESASWGVTYSRRPVTVMAKWNWRAEQKNGAAAAGTRGADAFNYVGARTHLDLNVDFQITRRMSIFANGRNVFNARNVVLIYGPQTPEHAKVSTAADYGVQLSAGVKGSF